MKFDSPEHAEAIKLLRSREIDATNAQIAALQHLLDELENRRDLLQNERDDAADFLWARSCTSDRRSVAERVAP